MPDLGILSQPCKLMYNKNMELLAPAGDLEKLKVAVRFGADAVYCGAGSYSLRSPASSFSLSDLSAGVEFAHEHGCRVYLVMNIFPFDEDFTAMMELFEEAVSLGIDAVIVSDPGVITQIKKMKPSVKIHLSTQANSTNSHSVRFWRDQGAERIILARELSLQQIGAIRKSIEGVELEVFVHGAMCMAYSGRCLLSSYLNKRSANLGLCTQPCRWEYKLREVNRQEELTVCEDERGTYILNSKDLCMINHIPELFEAGIDSIKIEGRMKTAYYVAAVTRIYRAALKRYQDDPPAYKVDPLWLEELSKVSHRPYCTGFFLPDSGDEREYTDDSSYIRDYDFVGTVTDSSSSGDFLLVSARNRFSVGDKLEILDPDKQELIQIAACRIDNLRTGAPIESAHNSYSVKVHHNCDNLFVNAGSIIRKKVKQDFQQ